MAEKDHPIENAPYEEARIAPALETTGEGSASAEPSALVFGKRAIAALVALAVVVVLGVCVAFGLGGSQQGSANSAAVNANAPAAASAEGNKAPENAAPGNQAPDQASNEASQGQSEPAPASSEEPKSEQTASAENLAASSASQQSAQPPAGAASSAPADPAPAQQQPSAPAPAPATITVSVYIDSSRAPGYPACMASTSVTIPAGSSVYDALRATGVSIGGSSTYVRSINGLAEKLPGYEAGSGWMYSVNGVRPSQSCGGYKLSGGESIRWSYTLNMGHDL